MNKSIVAISLFLFFNGLGLILWIPDLAYQSSYLRVVFAILSLIYIIFLIVGVVEILEIRYLGKSSLDCEDDSD